LIHESGKTEDGTGSYNAYSTSEQQIEQYIGDCRTAWMVFQLGEVLD